MKKAPNSLEWRALKWWRRRELNPERHVRFDAQNHTKPAPIKGKNDFLQKLVEVTFAHKSELPVLGIVGKSRSIFVVSIRYWNGGVGSIPTLASSSCCLVRKSL